MVFIGDLPPVLSSKVALDENGCWTWQAAKDKRGYGRVRWDAKVRFAHRVVYGLLVADPGHASLDHLCRVPSCVNPRHLEPVEHVENVRRGISAVATKTRYANHLRCPAGHPLFGENLYTHTTKAGYVNKQCRACRRETKRARRATGKRD